ncbi:MAG: phage tail tape measure protein, partial [Bacteroidota bacterium]
MKIADLFVKLGLKDRQFKQGMDGAQRRTNKFGAAMKRVGGMIAGVFAVGAIINFGRKAIGVITKFEQKNATLAATLGTGVDNIKELTKQAKELGKSTIFTSSQVAALQNELAKLGFLQSEIKDSTRGILDLAAATETDLAQSAAIAGQALRAFSLDSSEMARVTSVLAVATTKSALTMADYQTGLSNVAPVAKTFGFSIEETISLFGKLKDSGFDASKATTAIRNILLNLADSSGDLSKALGGNITSFDELIPALVKLRESGVDLNSTLQLTDKRSVAAFNQFLSGAEKAKVLRDDLIDVNEELQQMVHTKTETVEGALKKVSSAWEGLLLTASKSTGFLKRNLEALSNQLLIVQSDVLTTGEKWAAFLDPAGIASGGYGGAVKKMREAEEKAQAERERFNSLTLSQLESLYDSAANAYVESVKAGNEEAENDFSSQMSKIKTRIDEIIQKNEELNNSTNKKGSEKPYNTLEDAIESIRNKIAELQGQITQGEIIDPDKLKEATGNLQDYKNTLASLLSIYKNINRVQSMQPMTGQAGTPQIGDTSAPMPGGLADMSGFLEQNAERTRQYMDEANKDWATFGEQLSETIQSGAVDAISEFSGLLVELFSGDISGEG